MPSAAKFLSRAAWERSLRETLPGYLPRQRWFADQGREIHNVSLLDLSPLPAASECPTVLVIVHLDFDTGGGEYFLPLVFVGAPAGSAPLAPPLARMPSGEGFLYEAGRAPSFGIHCLRALAAQRELPGTQGGFVFSMSQAGTEWVADLARESACAVRAPRCEQSNTTLLFADAASVDRMLLKCFRRLQRGINPDAEVTRFLTERTAFAHVPRLAGTLTYGPAGEAAPGFTLAIFQEFVPNEGDGWQFLLRQLADPPRADELGTEINVMELLGERTAGLHRALASDAEDPAFAPEPIVAADIRRWSAALAAGAEAILPELRTLARGGAAELAGLATAILPACERLTTGGGGAAESFFAPLVAEAAPISKIRIHGDYHLGQTLRTPEGDFAILDFEGEPDRTIAERRQKHCALKDVASMLRSFDYAVRAAILAGAEPARAARWRALSRERFWNRYRVALSAPSPAPSHALPNVPRLLPTAAGGCRTVLAGFEIEKALYEFRYELRHRPDWLGIPLRGLKALLAAAP